MPIMASDMIAGVLVAENRCFRFVAVDRRFRVLDGSRFGHAEAARQSAVRLAKAAAEHETADPEYCLARSSGAGRHDGRTHATTPCRILLA